MTPIVSFPNLFFKRTRTESGATFEVRPVNLQDNCNILSLQTYDATINKSSPIHILQLTRWGNPGFGYTHNLLQIQNGKLSLDTFIDPCFGLNERYDGAHRIPLWVNGVELK